MLMRCRRFASFLVGAATVWKTEAAVRQRLSPLRALAFAALMAFAGPCGLEAPAGFCCLRFAGACQHGFLPAPHGILRCHGRTGDLW